MRENLSEYRGTIL